MTSLAGKVAVVTGASRGVGRGVALALGEQGATVYITGRTAKEGEHHLPGTVFSTAKEVDARGGKGIPVVCDHRDDAAVEALFERVGSERGRLDLLVNNAFIVHPDLVRRGNFWEKPLSMWDMVDVGLRSHYVASVFAARIMVEQRSGLIVNTSSPGGGRYSMAVAYGVGKAGVDRLAIDMAHELRPYNVAALSLWLGLVTTEGTRAIFARHPERLEAAPTESAQFTGRIIAALLADPGIMRRTGRVYIGAELAREYGVTDIDGSSPISRRAELGGPPWPLPEEA
jgi:NAD(P)-dependent dehydrogenase (short-subunit alcohol dehydrogenase family)